jgi:hypothetical protein
MTVRTRAISRLSGSVEAMQKVNEYLNRGVTGEYRSDPQTIV